MPGKVTTKRPARKSKGDMLNAKFGMLNPWDFGKAVLRTSIHGAARQ